VILCAVEVFFEQCSVERDEQAKEAADIRNAHFFPLYNYLPHKAQWEVNTRQKDFVNRVVLKVFAFLFSLCDELNA
jgi:hypothetical protein